MTDVHRFRHIGLYTYDPIGNITHIDDYAQQTIYFNNKRVEPGNDYIYDALYRLIQAAGRAPPRPSGPIQRGG